MSSIFISYSRKDIDFARQIVDALSENDLDTWIDWQSIPKGEDWKQEIDRGIEGAETFIFLMSPDSAKSEICNLEIAHALNNNKRIIPIVIRDTNPQDFHFEIRKKKYPEGTGFSAEIKLTNSTLQSKIRSKPSTQTLSR